MMAKLPPGEPEKEERSMGAAVIPTASSLHGKNLWESPVPNARTLTWWKNGKKMKMLPWSVPSVAINVPMPRLERETGERLSDDYRRRACGF